MAPAAAANLLPALKCTCIMEGNGRWVCWSYFLVLHFVLLEFN